MYHYTKTKTGYQLIDDTTNEVLFEGPKIAICFDKRCGTILRHGDPTIVTDYLEKTIQTYKQNNYHDMAQDIVIITSNQWPENLLNNCIEITGYIIKMIRLYGIKIIEPVGDIVDQMTNESAKKYGHRPAQPITPNQITHPSFPVEVLQYIEH